MRMRKPQVVQRRLEVSRLEEQVERLKAERRKSRYVALQEKVAQRGIYEHTRKYADEPSCVRTLETAPRRDSGLPFSVSLCLLHSV